MKNAHIHRRPVESSAIRSIGYDAEGGLLDVEYNDGDVYRYSGVSEAQYRALTASDSLGEYMNRHIKPRHRFERLGRLHR